MMHKFDKKISISRILNLLDRILFVVFIVVLIFLIATSTKVNISHDSVDYYGMLQWVTPEKEKPIVRNLHFAEQRSPGYSLLSLIPYSLLTVLVEPFVTTEKITIPPEFPGGPDSWLSEEQRDALEEKVEDLEARGASREEVREVVQQMLDDWGIEPPVRPRLTEEQRSKIGEMEKPKKMAGSKMMGFPPRPIFIKELFFKDFYIPMEGSWYQWKLALSLLLTSFFFLFIGIWANAKVLKLYYPASKCLFIIPATLVTAPMFMRSIFDLPLFTTLTYYGLASLFLLFVCLSFRSNKAWYIILSGFILGLLVLTRLELSILAVLLIGYFLFTRRTRFLLLLCLGGLVPFIVLVIYNLSLFGVPLHFGILRGDINIFGFNWQYIFNNLIHPESGVLFWTPLLIPGLVFLITVKDSILKVIGLCSFVLIIFYTMRIPIMYYYVGQGIIDIGGIPVTAPETPTQMRELTRFEINRYLCVLIPFSIIGVRIGIHKIYNLLGPKNSAK